MATWVFLFGCDDEPKGKTVEQNGIKYHITEREPGCDSDVKKADIEREDGKKGTITLDWSYVPATVITLMVLTFVGGVARVRR